MMKTALNALFSAICALLAMASAGQDVAHAQTLPVTSNLRMRLDASDVNGNGSVPANGATITQWKDLSGLAHHATTSGSASVTYEANGMNGLPSVRFPLYSTMDGPNLFTSGTSQETTIFVITDRVTETSNFAFSLNGQNQGSSGTTARFSLHLPFSNGVLYFDAGGCCTTTTRLSFIYGIPIGTPAMVTAGNSTNGFSGMTGVKKFLHLNALSKATSPDAIAPYVQDGLHLGSEGSTPYNGRFSEILVYDRALSTTEIRAVECYLAHKWQISNVTGCTPVALSVSKSDQIFSGSPEPSYNLPNSELIYSLGVNYVSGDWFDNGSFFLVDSLPSTLEFYHGDLDGSFGANTDPVGFIDSGSGLVWNYANSVGYSNVSTPPSSKTDCNYTPIAGYDPNVRYICVFPSGVFESGNIVLKYRARIK